MAKVALERWRPHVEAVAEAGISLAQYARDHGLSRHTLYAARQAMGDENPPRGSAKRQSGSRTPAFVPVQVRAPLTSTVSVRLPNGVEVCFGQMESAALAPLLTRLWGLPCSV